ncbi:Trm112 family protein [Dactylosporangium sp. NPDC049140]|uniref:Trm112 family protein n=1 Tax=Dactylosporangium sp. NPDC049140 TaxID=3155647 RepID=UPI0033D2DA51
MSVDPALLSILRCPDEHHAELTLDPEAQTLTCTECGRIFEIRDGIPVLLLDEARPPAAGDAVENGADGESAKAEEGGEA